MQNGEALAELRTKKKLSQKDVANMIQTSLCNYKKYELNILPMTLEKLNILANLYQVSLNYLLSLSKKKSYKKISDYIDYSYLRFSLRRIRKLSRLNQKKLAQEFQVSYVSISKYENEKTKNVTLDYLIKFAKKYRVSIDYLCGKSIQKEIL